MAVLSEKGKRINIKTEAALSSVKPFEKQPVEYEEGASRRKFEVTGTDIETEYEEMDTEEESEVRKLTKKNWKCISNIKNFTQYKQEPKERYTVLVIYTDSKLRNAILEYHLM